jgi:hypothetical protein
MVELPTRLKCYEIPSHALALYLYRKAQAQKEKAR